MYKLQI